MDKKNEETEKESKLWILFLTLGLVFLGGGVACLLAAFFAIDTTKTTLDFPTIPSKKEETKTYSLLTGEELSDASLVNAPTYCIQTPNGTDGARPHAGLNEAGVVFEAIAEAGITRFAAIYQNPSSAVIGPIRSLRLYYLQWDTPFDCTIVHAGGADDALAALKNGGYKDLTENYTYMYRGTYKNRRWNNLFTTAGYLKQWSVDRGYTTSNIKGFSRLTPEEALKNRVDTTIKEQLEITKAAESNTSEMAATATGISLKFGGMANYNVKYNYDSATNTYLRGYESGAKHEVYVCPNETLGEVNPEDKCTLSQIAPSVVIAMIVKESKAADNYHESIQTIGSGDVYIFQNGTAVKGEWTKTSKDEQIKFTDQNGKEIKLNPGQTFISAIPTYGSVDF